MNPLTISLHKPSECTGFKGVVILAGFVCNFAQGQPSITDGYSAIPHIFTPRRPSTVIGGIARVVVDAVKLVVSGGARPHVFVERFKRHIPSFAHGYPSCPVVFETFARVFCAPCTHSGPSVPLRRPVHAMRYRSFLGLFPGNTSARLSCTIFETHATDNHMSAACTNAGPARLFSFVFGTGDHRKFAVDRSHKVFSYCHLNQSKLVPIL